MSRYNTSGHTEVTGAAHRKTAPCGLKERLICTSERIYPISGTLRKKKMNLQKKKSPKTRLNARIRKKEEGDKNSKLSDEQMAKPKKDNPASICNSKHNDKGTGLCRNDKQSGKMGQVPLEHKPGWVG